MSKSAARGADALRIIFNRYYKGRPARIAALHEALLNDAIARQIRELRERAGLTQRRLAKRVGTTASVICRLEDAEYEGHSLSMLRRIAEALNKRLEVRFVDRTKSKSA